MAWLDILKLAKSPIQQAYEKYKPTVAEALGKGQEFIDRTSGYSALPEEARRAVDMAVDYSPIGGTIIGKSATGWAQAEGKFSNMLDKMERAEISDVGARIKEYPYETGTLFDFLEHPNKIYAQYPELRKVDTVITIDPTISKGRGQFQGYENRASEGLHDLQPQIQVTARNKEEAKDILLHEVQHYIQEIEGFSRGGNPSMFDGQYEYVEIPRGVAHVIFDLNPNAKLYLEGKGAITKDRLGLVDEGQKLFLRKDLSMDKYRALGGEIESRSVARRSNIPQDQLKYSQPYAGENIPLKEWIRAEDYLDQ